MKRLFTIICFVTLLTTISFADTINVPGDQATIQAGIDAAVDGDTVLVADGTYFENINYKGKAITVASHYFVDGDTSHISDTIIDGSLPSHSDSGSVVSFVSGEDTTSVLYGFTITKGTGTITESNWEGEVYPERVGGGIFCFYSGARISYNKITDNHVPEYEKSVGGGIAGFPNGSTAYIIIEGNQIVNNSVTGVDVYSSAIDFACNGMIKNNDISFNTCNATNSAFGTIDIFSETINPRFVVVKNNRITYNQINGNKAYAGGILIEHGSNVSVIDNEISSNELNGTNVGRGGGIWVVLRSGTTIIDGNSISDNIVNGSNGLGGGIALHRSNLSNSNTVITNNIISGNVAAEGGGIYSRSSISGIINNTIVNNNASSKGGGIGVNGTKPVVINSILWNNQAPDGPQILGSPVVAYSNIQDSIWAGEKNISADPLFVDTLFNLSANSLCVGTGASTITINGMTYSVPLTDFDGNVRPNPVDQFVDIGAIESPHPKQPTGIAAGEPSLPINFTLHQNYPNPFNPRTTISYQLPQQSTVELAIYNTTGQKIATLVSHQQVAGSYQYEWNVENELASGVYFYKLTAGQRFVQMKKLLLLK